MKKILVTGKNGDLSRAVASYLNSQGYCAETVSLRGEEWKNGDYSSYDSVVHIAGIVPKSGATTEDFYKINSDLTRAFSAKVKADGVKHFVYISSMAVYGKEPSIDVKKGLVTADTPCEPTSDYGKSKLLAEKYLQDIEDENFAVARIRVPSIYGKGKTEYLEQYKHLNEKFKKIPEAFKDRYKSVIYIDNLCALIYLTVTEKAKGVICPDDGQYSAYDICRALSPQKKTSRLMGLGLEILLKKNISIKNYYGAIFYDKNLTEIYEGKYRIQTLEKAISEIIAKER
ncbi:MAG: NAD-dependent epimerase/dehydratase family protein [Clostridia bacterium]|nr:NAD-dependent epimerase/dehydratase family protein [Clostridia bacterium]